MDRQRSLELWLVRHGETTFNADRRIAGWCDPPLTDLGRRQAAAVGPAVAGEAFDSVWSSDLQRSVDTARLAWGDATPDERLRECNFGIWEGRSFDEVDAVETAVFMRFRDFDIEGGDSHDSFRRRIEGFVDGLPAGRHLLFVHGGVIRILTQDLGLDRFVQTGSVVGVDWSDGRLLFVRENGSGRPNGE
jgi:probable phosphoglycerate mutase